MLVHSPQMSIPICPVPGNWDISPNPQSVSPEPRAISSSPSKHSVGAGAGGRGDGTERLSPWQGFGMRSDTGKKRWGCRTPSDYLGESGKIGTAGGTQVLYYQERIAGMDMTLTKQTPAPKS